MEFMFRKNEKILLIGEGNFSFCRDLVSWIRRKMNISECGVFNNVYATCFEDEPHSNIKDETRKYLKNEGVQLVYNVDATKLCQHNVIATLKFQKIIFNFPHINGKMRMDLNRALLTNFFVSAAPLLNKDGNVVLSLCEGQGGTPIDKPRRYDDTWKVVECGAVGGFILSGTSPWPSHLLSNYRSVGFRGQEKPFRTEGAIVHVFSQTEPLDAKFVPDNLMGFNKVFVPGYGSLEVPLAYIKLLENAPFERIRKGKGKEAVQAFVETRILECSPINFSQLQDLPLTTKLRVDKSQIECLLDGELAFLRTSFEQVMPVKGVELLGPCYASGVIFRSTSDDFKAFPGSYQILLTGCDDMEQTIIKISTRLGIPLDSKWCLSLTGSACLMDLDQLSLLMFKTSLQNTKQLWSSRTRMKDIDPPVVEGISLYPPTFTFDISFSSEGPQSEKPFHALLHNLADDLIDSVVLQSRYSPEGSPAVHHCHRITYRSFEKPLHRACVVKYQHNAMREACENYLNVTVR